MANTLITPDIIAKRLLAHLYNETIFAGLVYRDFEPEFQGKQGHTITVQTPATFTASEFDQNVGVVPQNITEGSTTVTLDKFPDVSVEVTTKELTLELDKFDERVLNPMKEALVQYIDGLVAECLVDTAIGAGGGGTVSGVSSPNAAFRGAKAKLGRGNLPTSERYYVLSPEAENVVSGEDIILSANRSGSTDGLREGAIGRISGMDGFSSNALGFGPDNRGQADGVAFHKSAVALVTRVPALPMGTDKAATASFKGIGLRVVQGYDTKFKKDLISIDLLAGVSKVEGREHGAIVLDFGVGS